MRRLLAAAALLVAPQLAARTLVVEGTIDAPPAVVWKLYTTKEGIESWMAAHADVDLRVGGTMRVVYDPKDTLGGPKTITNTILDIDPGRMISMKATGLPEGFPYPKAIATMWTVVYFNPVDDGKTLLRAVCQGIPDDAEGEQLYKFFERGNRVTVERLQKHVQSLRAPAP